MEHEYSEKWTPYRDRNGHVVTITEDQLQAIWHCIMKVNDLRRTTTSKWPRPPIEDPGCGSKSRALGRLLIEGKPLFVDCPPHEMGAPAYWLWDDENEGRFQSGA